MSEVIVRMEMPFSCAVCRCHSDGLCCLLSIQQSECTYYSRPSWCPITGEIPEQHGDLIDRDETFHAAQPEDCTDELWAKTTCGRVVLEAKTVIPATERKKHE